MKEITASIYKRKQQNRIWSCTKFLLLNSTYLKTLTSNILDEPPQAYLCGDSWELLTD